MYSEEEIQNSLEIVKEVSNDRKKYNVSVNDLEEIANNLIDYVDIEEHPNYEEPQEALTLDDFSDEELVEELLYRSSYFLIEAKSINAEYKIKEFIEELNKNPY